MKNFHQRKWADKKKPNIFQPNNLAYPFIIFIIALIISTCVLHASFSDFIAANDIHGSLSLGQTQRVWSGVIYLIMLAYISPISGRISKVFGLKTSLFTGVCFFFLGELMAGLSSNFLTFFSGRLISGIGSGLVVPLTLMLVSITTPEKYRSLAISLWICLSFGLGIISGVATSGYIADTIGWRATFLIPVYTSPIVLYLIWLVVHENKKEHPKPIKIWEVFFHSIYIGSLIIWIGNVKLRWNTDGFNSFFSVFFLSLTIVCLICFIIASKKSPSPFLMISLFKDSSFLIGCISTFIVGIFFYSSIADFAEIMINNLHYQKTIAGIKIAPFGVAMSTAGIMGTLYIKKFGFLPIAILGLGLIALSGFLGHSLTIHSEPIVWQYILIIKASGIGLSLGPLTALTLKNISPDNVPGAAAIVTFLRQLSSSIGILLTILIKALRIPFHLLRFGEQMNLQSPAFLKYLQLRDHFLVTQAGESPEVSSIVEARLQAFTSGLFSSPLLDTFSQSLIIAHENALGNAAKISTRQILEFALAQANILSISDAYWIFSWIIIAFIVWIIFLRIREENKREFYSKK